MLSIQKLLILTKYSLLGGKNKTLIRFFVIIINSVTINAANQMDVEMAGYWVHQRPLASPLS